MRLKQLILVYGSLILMISGCTLRKLSPEHPYASPSRISKDFFVTMGSDGKMTHKTFFAGWAPESTAGDLWSTMLNMNSANHMNLQFEITENYLIGKKVNPTYPNNRDRWETVIRIPISKHFYYEPDKDQRGRETNTYVENDRRSDWSARPYMNLDLQRAQFANWDIGALGGAKLTPAENIEDIEWDKEKGFLGFSLTHANWHQTWYGTLTEQAKVRVNFLKFEHDKTFQPTPFDARNAEFMNILHILGKQINGDASRQELYAAKWDTRKKTDIYLYGFPKEYEAIAKECVELWNNEFERMKHGRPFVVKISKRKYAFDLREPSLIWIDDRRISLNAPLGVSQTIADVQNGKMLWTGITIWGGLLHEIINNYAPYSLENTASATGKKFNGVQSSLLFSKKNTADGFNNIPRGLFSSPGISEIASELQRLNVTRMTDQGELKKMALEQAQFFESSLKQFQAKNLSQAALLKNKSPDFLQSVIGMPTIQESMDQLSAEGKSLMTSLKSQAMQQESFKKVIQSLKGNSIDQLSDNLKATANVHDFDLRFDDVARQWTQSIGAYQMDKVQVTRTVLKNIIIHELGHSMGLGHNFKENILPEKGTVPDKYLEGYTDEKGVKHPSLLANAKNHFTNMSTVMGYPSGHTEVQFKYEDILPGPHDQLVMEYIYNKRYPIYAKGNTGKEDYEYQELPASGLVERVITKNGKTYVPGFFPQCNDLDASYNLDPYCNRFDRGFDAPALVQNYFDDFDGSLLSQLNAFSNTVKGSSPEYAEYYLWMRSLDLFSRTRTFYDLMRLKYKEDFAQLAKGTPQEATRNLQEFSEACVKASKNEKIENAALSQLLTNPKKKELVSLCLATAKMLNRTERLMQLPGPDTTLTNYFDRVSIASIVGGDAQPRTDIFGKWKELARLPIKFSGLLTSTTASPFVNLHGWLIPLPMYSDAQSSFHISTFYPKEYISMIASTMKNNITISSTVNEQTTKIGRAILALGFLIQNSYFSNDSLIVPKIFLDEIRRQTRYDYNYVVVAVQPQDEKEAEIARAFSGTAQGLFSNSSESLEAIYLYTSNRVIFSPPISSFLYPLTELRWISNKSGIFFALKLDYSDQANENLQISNIRSDMQSLLRSALDNCILGPGQTNNGLKSFFNRNSETLFPGFVFPKTISLKETDRDRFKNSLQEQFSRYYSNVAGFPVAPRPEQCEAAINAQNLIIMAASAMNGFYFTEIYDYMEKGQ